MVAFPDVKSRFVCPREDNMAENEHFPLLDRQIVTASQNGKMYDLYPYNALNIGATIHTAGSAGNIKL